ncbi:MAG: hypothetical protein ACI4DK_05385 [Lachnospiraceae bacterium]
MRDNFQILFQTADISLLLSNIIPKVCLLVISHGKSAQLVQKIVKSEILIDKPSEFVSKVMKLPYSEVVFQKCKEDLQSGNAIKNDSVTIRNMWIFTYPVL